jgi:hypothetical protein
MIHLLGDGEDLVLGEVPAQIPDHPLFSGEGEIHTSLS